MNRGSPGLQLSWQAGRRGGEGSDHGGCAGVKACLRADGSERGGGTFGYGAAQKNAGDHRICGEAGGQSLEDRQDVPHKRRTDHGAKPPVRQHDPAGRQADFGENGAGIELVPRVTVVRCCFLLKNKCKMRQCVIFPECLVAIRGKFYIMV